MKTKKRDPNTEVEVKSHTPTIKRFKHNEYSSILNYLLAKESVAIKKHFKPIIKINSNYGTRSPSVKKKAVIYMRFHTLQ